MIQVVRDERRSQLFPISSQSLFFASSTTTWALLSFAFESCSKNTPKESQENIYVVFDCNWDYN